MKTFKEHLRQSLQELKYRILDEGVWDDLADANITMKDLLDAVKDGFLTFPEFIDIISPGEDDIWTHGGDITFNDDGDIVVPPLVIKDDDGSSHTLWPNGRHRQVFPDGTYGPYYPGTGDPNWIPDAP